MKDSFKKCAQEAGIGKGESLHVVSEPEAAATYALHAMHPHDIKVGDTFGKGPISFVLIRHFPNQATLCYAMSLDHRTIYVLFRSS